MFNFCVEMILSAYTSTFERGRVRVRQRECVCVWERSHMVTRRRLGTRTYTGVLGTSVYLCLPMSLCLL